MKIRNFRDLKVWQTGMTLAMDIYILTRLFPRNEIYGLISQMRRAAVSIPSNIAEGFNRFHNKEYRHFLYMALGSCAELETQITIAKELKYLSGSKEIILLEKTDHIGRMITNLIKKLK